MPLLTTPIEPKVVVIVPDCETVVPVRETPALPIAVTVDAIVVVPELALCKIVAAVVAG